MPPPLPPHDRRAAQQNLKSPRPNAIGNSVAENNRANRFSRNAAAAASTGLSLYNNEALSNVNSNSTDQLQQGYGDTQTLRADDSRLQFRGNALAMNPPFNSSDTHNNQISDNNISSETQNKQSAEPMALSVRLLKTFFYPRTKKRKF